MLFLDNSKKKGGLVTDTVEIGLIDLTLFFPAETALSTAHYRIFLSHLHSRGIQK